MARAYKITWIWAIGLSFTVFIAWPLLTLPAGVFSKGYFRFWIGLAMTWGTAAGVTRPSSLKFITLIVLKVLFWLTAEIAIRFSSSGIHC